MSADPRRQNDLPPHSDLSEDDLLSLHRAMLVLHSVRTAAHEMNNAFQMIGGSVELLQDHPRLPDEARPRLESILRQVRRGEGLMRGVADLTRREPGRPRAVDLVQAVNRALAARRFEHGRAGHSVQTDVPGGSWSVRADPAELHELLLNLLIQVEQSLAGRASGVIRVELRREEQQVELSVSGMAAGGSSQLPAGAPASTGPWDAIGARAAHLIAARSGGGLTIRPAGDGLILVLRLPESERSRS